MEPITKKTLLEGIEEHESEFGERPEEIRMRSETWKVIFNYQGDQFESITEPTFFQGISIIIDEKLPKGTSIEMVGTLSE
ncbi:hypothetical protein NSU01_19910 [Paenibacillus sp. FSL H8-0259]|uniref:hypothetical protein n=1 Tax=Paenibacillus sp. FSL H8-0259 TaxID=1920423 RepID=UPI001180B7E2